MNIHVNHPNEVTPELRRACGQLADAGIPLGSQTVLLKGINDKPYIMKKLVQELLRIRVRPCLTFLGSDLATSLRGPTSSIELVTSSKICLTLSIGRDIYFACLSLSRTFATP
jgi:hypothetical protein